MPKTSGQPPFAFSLCDDLYSLPEAARPCEVDLHGGFAVDTEPGGRIYYGMPGCGLMSIASDLRSQEIIELPPDLKPINFHSTKLVQFDGKRRLVMPANGDAKVVVLGLDGNLDFVLSRPEFDEYQDAETPFNPTDTAYADGTLYVADGYGANHISTADLGTQQWKGIFAGKTDDPKIVASMINVGKRPLQGTKLFVRMAISRSRGESITRVAVTPAALQPKPIAIVSACLPWAPDLRKSQSRLKATRGR